MSEGVNNTGKKPELTKEQKKKANILCIVSIVLGFVVPLICGALCYVFEDNGMETMSAMILFPAAFCFLAGIALMVIVRAKYSRSVFGKVLMILYIVCGAIGVIGAVFIIGACLTVCTDPTW